ncbi:MAG: division/cell wall cluster transcriptional repressor MraZ [Bacteroidetes bacterium]|nr:division/cell wall cluster transcriptional repressor MraZ [Bacteroidota bacterium]
MQLIGEFQVALDNKGRMRLPTALLRQLSAPTATTDEQSGYEFVVNRGFEKCLTLYPKPVWDAITIKLSKLNRFNDRNRMFIRSFYLGAYPVTTDSADRILLQKPLMDYAGLQDDAILVAMDDRIEIWSPDSYQSLASMDSNAFADLANQVMGGGEDGAGAQDGPSLDALFGHSGI